MTIKKPSFEGFFTYATTDTTVVVPAAVALALGLVVHNQVVGHMSEGRY